MIFCSKKSKLMLVTMATPISSHVKDKNSIFTARDKDMIFLVKEKILVFHQWLYNKKVCFFYWQSNCNFFSWILE